MMFGTRVELVPDNDADADPRIPKDVLEMLGPDDVLSTDATSCKVCGGPFGAKRIIIEDHAYHERCALMSHGPHTHRDYVLLHNRLNVALDALLAIRTASANPANQALCLNGIFEIATRAIREATKVNTPEHQTP